MDNRTTEGEGENPTGEEESPTESEFKGLGLVKILNVLSFYGLEKNYDTTSTGFAVQYDPEPSPIEKDHGKKARESIEVVSLALALLNDRFLPHVIP